MELTDPAIEQEIQKNIKYSLWQENEENAETVVTVLVNYENMFFNVCPLVSVGNDALG